MPHQKRIKQTPVPPCLCIAREEPRVKNTGALSNHYWTEYGCLASDDTDHVAWIEREALWIALT